MGQYKEADIRKQIQPSAPGTAVAAVAARRLALLVGHAPPRAQHVPGRHERRERRARCRPGKEDSRTV